MPDHDNASEQAVLGAIMLSGGAALDDDLAEFDPADYFRPQHEELHKHLAKMHRNGETIDMTTVAAVMSANSQLRMNPVYAHDLSMACISPASARHYADKVKVRATIRRGRDVGRRLVGMDESLAEEPDALDAALDSARRDLDRESAARSPRITTFADVADAAIDSIGAQVFTPTPWTDFNHLVHGWMPAHFYTFGSRPGTGKTITGVQAAVHAAKNGLNAAYYTYEMTGPRLYQRALAAEAGVDLKKFITGQLSDAEWRAIARSDREVLRDLPILVEGSAGWSASQLVAHAKVAHRRRPLGIVFIDHIGRVAPSGKGRSPEQETAEAANRFLDMAHQLNAAVVVFSQLNRGPAQRSDPRPVLTDLRNSDVIEQNSDIVTLMYRDIEEAPDVLEWLVAKNRDGVVAPLKLEFDGARSRINDLKWSPAGSLAGAR